MDHCSLSPVLVEMVGLTGPCEDERAKEAGKFASKINAMNIVNIIFGEIKFESKFLNRKILFIDIVLSASNVTLFF